MNFAILGIGTALPEFVFTRDDAARVAQVLCLDPRQKQLVPVLYRQTEIDQRYLILGEGLVQDVLEGTRTSESPFLPDGSDDDRGPTTRERMEVYIAQALPLALRAARHALAQSETSPNDITHLVTVSCSGFSAPGVDVGLIKQLGLSSTVERTHVGFMGCHGALNGLRVARGITAAEPEACVLLCAVELCSLHYAYGWDPKKVVANALFGDGAAALVGRRASPQDEHWQVTASGAGLFPDSEFAMTWNIGDHGFDMTLSTKVPNLIERNLRPWLENWLAKHHLRIEDVRSWAIHPGGPRILTAVNEALGLAHEATAVSLDVLTQHGNMSSPTVLFILERLRERQAPLPCVALGFGPGLAVEGALFGRKQ